MTLKRVYGPCTILELSWDVVYGPNFVVHLVHEVKPMMGAGVGVGGQKPQLLALRTLLSFERQIPATSCLMA